MKARRVWSLVTMVPDRPRATMRRYEGTEQDGEVVFVDRVSRAFILRIPLDSALFLARHPKYLGTHTHLHHFVATSEDPS